MADTGDSSLTVVDATKKVSSLPESMVLKPAETRSTDTVPEPKSDPRTTDEPGRESLCSLISACNTICKEELHNESEKGRNVKEHVEPQSISENQEQSKRSDQSDQVIESTTSSLTRSHNVQNDRSSDGEVVTSNRDESGLETSRPTVVPQVNPDCQPMDVSNQEALASKSEVASISLEGVNPATYEPGGSDAGHSINNGDILSFESKLNTECQQTKMSQPSVQATESNMKAQPSQVPQSDERNAQAIESDIPSASQVPQSFKGNVQVPESKLESASPISQSNDEVLQATERNISLASQVPQSNKENVQTAEGEMTSANQVTESNEEIVQTTESDISSASQLPHGNEKSIHVTESEMNSASPVPRSSEGKVQSPESEMASANQVPQSNEENVQATNTPSLTEDAKDGGCVDQVAMVNSEGNEAQEQMDTDHQQADVSDLTVVGTDNNLQPTDPSPQAGEEVQNGPKLLISNKDIPISETRTMEVLPDTDNQQTVIPDMTAEDCVPNSENSGSNTEPGPTTESLQTNKTDQNNQGNDCRMASPSPSPRVLSGTELIMSYRDLSSSATSSSDDSSSCEGLLTDSSSDEAEGSSKPVPAKVNGQRPPRRGSREGSGVAKTKGELQVEDLPPLEDLHIEVDDSVVLHEVGNVSSVVGLLVIVKGQREVPALNADTILFSKDRKVLGQVFEIFGPVASPFYSIRFNTSQQIEERGIKVGFPVFFAPRVQEFTHYVFLEQLRQLKGSDASWEHNNEPPAQHLDYSDDEEERRARARQRGRDVPTGENGEQEQLGKKRRNRNQRKNRKPGQQDEHRKENDSQVPANIQTWPPEAGGQRNFQGPHRSAYRPPANNPFSQVGGNRFHHGSRGHNHRPQGRGGQAYHNQYQQRPAPPVDGSRNRPPYMMHPPAPGPTSNGYYYGFPGSYPQRSPMGPASYPPRHDSRPPGQQSQSQSPPPGVSGAPGGGVSYITGASPTTSHPRCPASASASSSGYDSFQQNTSTYPPGTDCPLPQPPVPPGCPPAPVPASAPTPQFSGPPPSHTISPPGVSNSRPVDMRYVQNAGPNAGPNTTPSSASNWQPPQPPYFGRYPPPPAEFGGYPSFQSGPQMGWMPPR